jgi:hypothetical protein
LGNDKSTTFHAVAKWEFCSEVVNSFYKGCSVLQSGKTGKTLRYVKEGYAEWAGGGAASAAVL